MLATNPSCGINLPATLDGCIALSGRAWAWPLTVRWLERQHFPHERMRLHLLDTSGNEAFSAMVLAWAAQADYASVQVERWQPAQPGLAAEDRQTQVAAVREVCAQIYNHLAGRTTADLVFTLEDDNEPPADAILQLLASLTEEAMSVSASYLSRDHLDLVAWNYPSEGRPEPAQITAGVQRVGGHGFGCALVRGAVLRAQPFHNGPPYQDYDFNFFHAHTVLGKWQALVNGALPCRHYQSATTWAATSETAAALRFLDESKAALSILHLNAWDVHGGAEQVALGLIQQQQVAGHSAQLLVGRKAQPLSEGVPLEMLPPLPSLAGQEDYPDYWSSASHTLLTHPLVENAEVLHLHNLYGGWFNPWSLIGLSHFRPVVWTLHDLQAISGYCAHSLDCERWKTGCGHCPDLTLPGPALTRDITAELWRDKALIASQSRLHLVACSAWAAQRVGESFLRQHPLTVIPNGVDAVTFQPADRATVRQQLGLPAEALILGGVASCGTLSHPWKGGNYVREVLAALRPQFPNLVFLNIGGEVQEDGIISLPFRQSRAEMATAYAAMDVLLFPSIAENAPLTVLEAMACARPVAAFAVGGIPEQVRHGQDGLLATPRAGAELTQHVRTLLLDPILRATLGGNARARVEAEFTDTLTASRYAKLYRSVVGQSVRESAGNALLARFVLSEQRRLNAESKLSAERKKRQADQETLAQQRAQFLEQPWLQRLVAWKLAPAPFRRWWHTLAKQQAKSTPKPKP